MKKLLLFNAYHFLALLLLSLFAFTYHSGLLLQGNDGPTNLAMANTQLFFFGISPHLHSNIFEGIGNTSFPFNLSMLPGFWLSTFFHTSTFTIALLYTWFALQLFVSVLLIGWNYGFTQRISYRAAWLLTLLLFPYFEHFHIYPVSSNSPEFLSIILVFALMDIGIQRIGSKHWLSNLAYVAVLLTGLLIGLVVCPANLILIAPLLFITTLYSFICARDRSELMRKIFIGIVLLALIIAAGWVEFLIGLVFNTAANFFNGEMSPAIPRSLEFASILFHRFDDRKMGPWLFCAATIGILFTLRKVKEKRPLAIMILLAQILTAGLSVWLLYLPKPGTSLGLSPVYFELGLFPFYALFAAYTFELLIPRSFTPHPFVLAIALFFCLLLGTKHITERHSSLALIPTSTAITDILEKEIALSLHQAFNGRVVNIIPRMSYDDQFQYFYQLNTLTGNDHQTTGLWLKNIPTLHEYNQVITPGFYCLYRHFLSDNSDEPHRSWSNFTQTNPSILKLLGVRFILSTLPHIQHTTHRAALTFKDDTIPTLHLYELKNVNTAGISAKNISIVHRIPEAETQLANPHFDLKTAVLLSSSSIHLENLIPANSSQIIIEKGGFHLQAHSKGQTLLILPIEFSHCLTATVISGDTPQIMRVDIALTGILFNHSVDILLDNRTGPFMHPRCKWKDYQEFSHYT